MKNDITRDIREIFAALNLLNERDKSEVEKEVPTVFHLATVSTRLSCVSHGKET